jgi:hypothetical protein
MWSGLENTLWFLSFQRLRRQSLIRLRCPNSLFTPAVQRCTKISNRISGGPTWNIAKYVAECDTCHCMKASHLKSLGVLQPLSIPLWKWDDISVDFIVGLPLTARRKDSIWFIVDRLTKTAHFIAVHTTYSVQQYSEIYMDQIVCLHGILRTIISDRGTQFVARF